MMATKLPSIIFGTSGLGNLYVALNEDIKLQIVKECLKHSEHPAVFDSAGKYGAGLALESLGQSLANLQVDPAQVRISNKLGWLRTDLLTEEPLFEPGVWKDLRHDAVQKISYEGILECYEQGNTLLGNYPAKMLSVHDPDEYLAGSSSADEYEGRYRDILDAYVALHELKSKGKVDSIGVGAKDWKTIQKISEEVQLDWVMFANSMTVHSHPMELMEFMKKLQKQEVTIINSAIFNGGFLTGSDWYNYQPVSQADRPDLYEWRDSFYSLCKLYSLNPAAVCTSFAFHAPGVNSVALNTTNPNRIESNIKLKDIQIPSSFWQEMRRQKLIDDNYLFHT
ncbi:MAG: aldo/keto reductase [Pedobacter sp.]